MPGNKSPNRPKKIGRSAAIILGKLKSLKALYNKLSSDTSNSALLKVPF